MTDDGAADTADVAAAEVSTASELAQQHIIDEIDNDPEAVAEALRTVMAQQDGKTLLREAANRRRR
jgi:hypothetical protein